ncbi:MAG: cyclic nucleotide-binding domain-containing protein [Proteobacteria bacterium]|nr:cyclic nucleotide-binding domain-containing protein [Pseudomonadota bacterium]
MAGAQINADIGPVATAAELRDVQRFKYDIYVAEMGRYGAIADHANRLLLEVDDAASHIYQARVGGKLAATMRLTWGGDTLDGRGALGARHLEQYDLAPFLEVMPMEQIVVGERMMIDPEFRGSSLLVEMFSAFMAFVNQRRIQLVFGDCEPHLLNAYQALGYRTYTARHVNSPETGYLIPLVIVPEDMAYLRRIGSPLAPALRDFGADARVPAGIDALLAGGAAVQSHRLADPAQYLAGFRDAARAAGALATGLFRGMSEAEIAVCLEQSVTIACRPGDRVLKRGNVATNMGLVLSGRFEVRDTTKDGDTVVAEFGPGEVFGEIAFFLKLPRTMDVIAVGGDARIVSFSDRTIRALIESHSETAATLLYNISVMLCERLRKTNEKL